MTAYFIDGREAREEDYVDAIEALSSDWDESVEIVCIEIRNAGKLEVCNWPGGFCVFDKRLDGSEWRSPVINRERAKEMVAAFLRGDAWRDGLDWELTELATKHARRRLLIIVSVGVILIVLGWLLFDPIQK